MPQTTTVANLVRGAQELEHNAAIKQLNGDPAAAAAYRQQAEQRLRQAAHLTPHLADFYLERANRVRRRAGANPEELS